MSPDEQKPKLLIKLSTDVERIGKEFFGNDALEQLEVQTEVQSASRARTVFAALAYWTLTLLIGLLGAAIFQLWISPFLAA